MSYLAAAAGTASPEPALVRVQGDDQIVEFAGQSIASSTTNRPGKPRWLDMELWRVTDGTGRYVVQRVGRSLVYHRYNGPCGRGVPVHASELLRDALPCADCGTPALTIVQSLPGYLVMREAEHPGVTICQDAQQVLRSLRLPDIGYSAPAQRLLDMARLRDGDINAAMSTIHQL